MWATEAPAGTGVAIGGQLCFSLPAGLWCAAKKTLLFTLDQHSVSQDGISGQANESNIGGKCGERPRASDRVVSLRILC